MLVPIAIGLMMATTVPATLESRADDAASTYVQCLFAVVRESGAAQLSQSAFEQRLAGSCLAEGRAYHALALRMLKLRGIAEPERKIDLVDRQTRAGLAEDYRSLPDKKRALEELNALCAANPERCP